MESPVPAEDGAWPRPVVAARDADIERRLAAIEHRLGMLESSIQDTVAQELQNTADEMRRAVSDLGRLLLRDLDRLTKVLADHRDAIVDRLHAAAHVPGVASDPQVAPGASDGAGPDDPDRPDEAPAMTGEAGRFRLPGRRRRKP